MRGESVGRVNHHTASRYLTRVSHPRHYSPSPKTSFIYTSLRSIDRRHLATPRKMSTPDDPTDDGLTIFFSCVSVFLGINAVVAVRSFLKSRNVDFQGTQFAAHTFANIYCLPHRTSLRSRQQGTGKDAHGIDDEFKNHVQGTGGFSIFVVFFNLVATFLTGYIVIGVPDNARELGFIALFPLTMCTCIGTFMNM